MTVDLAFKADYYVKAGLTGYDACYAALADDLSGYWLTYDTKAHKKIEKKNLEDKLQRSQTMESRGILASRVAHDLNNVLPGIVSYPDLLLIDLPADMLKLMR